MKKKIFFILNNFLIGGAEKFLAELIKFIDKEKFEIKIITILGSGPLAQEFGKSGAEINIFGPRQYPNQGVKKIGWIIVSFFKLTFFLIKNKPDILITSLWQSDIIGIFSAWLARVKKRVLIQHDVQPLNSAIRILKQIFAIKPATNIIANSFTVQGFLISYFKAPKDKIRIIYNGADFQYFKPTAARLPLTVPNGLVFGAIARLEPIKGHIYIIEALKILKTEGLAPKTLIYGDGILKTELENKAKEYGLDNTKFLGETLDIVKAFGSIDVFLAPSLSEGFGLAVLQALVAGKVVISSNLPAIKEFIVDGQNGILIETQNARALAQAIKNLLVSRPYFEEIKQKTINWLNGEGKKFDIRNVAKDYEAILN